MPNPPPKKPTKKSLAQEESESESETESESVPACTSNGCKTETAGKNVSEVPNPPPKKAAPAKKGLAQKQSDEASESVPACTSNGCQTDTAGQGVGEVANPPKKGSKAQMESIPACTSIGCKTRSAADPKKKKEVEVTYPNNGLDKDIKDSLKNTQDAEKKHGKWVLKEDLQTEESHPYQDLDKDINAAQKQSDPACTSLGCKTGSAADPKKKGHPVDYPVPDFGPDEDVKTT